ncbi:MAG: hypothetical protein EOP84_06990 [Verrucomicrobiaceae bacterium]|nr:MAG: hypothetical protein EOP84_06990 [Verrucomicrobiaceae bacterium]
MREFKAVMHVETEIKFECSGCGQRLSVNATGAGQTATCPACQDLVVVPQEDVVTRIATLTNGAVLWSESAERPSLPLDGPEVELLEPGEQLAVASRDVALLEHGMAALKEENGDLRLQLHEAAEERNRLLDAMEKLKSERLEIDSARAALVQEVEKLRRQSASLQAEVLNQKELNAGAEERLTVCEAECAARVGELSALREEAEGYRNRASLVDSLEAEIHRLRTDIAASGEAGEYNKLRIRAEAAEEAQKVQLRELENVRIEMEQFSKLETELRRQVAENKERCAAEERKVEALADNKVHKDNEVLRSVLGRQKVELEHCYRDLNRFRRAQLGLRLTYALFALGVVGVIAYVLYALPGLADFLKTL